MKPTKFIALALFLGLSLVARPTTLDVETYQQPQPSATFEPIEQQIRWFYTYVANLPKTYEVHGGPVVQALGMQTVTIHEKPAFSIKCQLRRIIWLLETEVILQPSAQGMHTIVKFDDQIILENSHVALDEIINTIKKELDNGFRRHRQRALTLIPTDRLTEYAGAATCGMISGYCFANQYEKLGALFGLFGCYLVNKTQTTTTLTNGAYIAVIAGGVHLARTHAE